jgi:hypothetical protein
VTGPVGANAGTLTEDNSITGWNSVTNALDAKRGQVADTNESLRKRREEELAKAGSATVRAIIADMSALEDDAGNIALQSVQVLENDGDVTDANGLPPHSVEVIVDDDPQIADTIIGQAIFDSKGGGIQAAGGIVTQATDPLGKSHTVRFTRPTEVDVYLIFHVEKAPDFPGDTLFAETVANTLTLEHLPGDDVFRWKCFNAAQIPGVVNVREVFLGFAAAPTATDDLPITARQQAAFDTSRISVVAV